MSRKAEAYMTQPDFYQTNPAYESEGSDNDSSHDYVDPSEWQKNAINGGLQHVDALKLSAEGGTATQKRRQYAIAMDLLRELPSRNMTGSSEIHQLDHVNENGVTSKQVHYKRQESSANTMRIRVGTSGLSCSNENADKLYQMLTKDGDATMEDMKENLRNMNQCLTLKRSVKAKLESKDEGMRKQRQLSCFKKLRYRFAMTLEHVKNEIQEIFQSLDLWHSHLKVVQGHFGSGVASYFFFLRHLFYMNFLAFVLLLSFIVIPQIAKTGSGEIVGNVSFTGRELFTGSDYFSNTILYYGFYSNGTVANYSIPHSYFFTNIALLVIFLFILTFSLAKSYRMNYVEVSGEIKNVFSNKLFSAWDYSIETENAARLKSHSIFNELMELLASERKDEEETTCNELLHLYFWRIFINVVIICSLCGTGYLTYTLLETNYLQKTSENSLVQEMALSVVVSIIAFVVPMIFSAMSSWEGYRSKQTEIYLNMFRIVLLRTVVLVVVTYFWLYKRTRPGNFATSSPNDTLIANPDDFMECWETQLGEEVYRLMVVDLFCVLILSTLGTELLRNLLHKLCCTFIDEPEFNIAQNTLDLVYTQTLTWLGFFYCPLLPLIALAKLFVVFYVKRISVVRNCRPSLKPWRAAHAQTVFLMLTFLNFILTVAATGYSIFIIMPSRKCGPFRHSNSRYASIVDLLNSLGEEGIVAKIFDLLVSPGIATGIILFLCVAVYFIRATAKAHEEMVNLLREQLIMEGKDKVFLLKLFKTAFYQADFMNTFDQEPRGSVGNIQRHDVVNEGYRDGSVQNRHYEPSEMYDAAALPNFPTGYLMANVPSQQTEQSMQPKPGWGRLRERSPDSRSSDSQDTSTWERRRPSAVPVDTVSAEHLRGRFRDELQTKEPLTYGEGSSKPPTPHEGSPFSHSTSGTPSGSLDRGRSDQLRAQKRNVPPVLPRPVHQHGFQYLTSDSPSYSPTRTSHQTTPSPRDSPRQKTSHSKQW